MKYACLVYAEMPSMLALSKEEGRRLDDDSLDYDKELEQRGHLIAGQALQSPETAVTIRVRDGRMSSTDGPFAETKEVLCGFILVEARDMNAALEIAAAIPMARYGSIEVRPILEINHS
ncbi:MAG TPA: YciI family protein [Devosiaceae bacterium]|jgi:hypothetical protein|nr:YciI family protein [Devosiaceae bacterium]